MERGEWAGAPLPVDHVALVMEPRYPMPGLNGFKFNRSDSEAKPDRPYEVINRWFSFARNVEVCVLRMDGKSYVGFDAHGPGRRLELWINTLGVAAQHVWSIEAEAEAVKKLSELVSEQAFRCYVLTGSFLETSKRSGVMYMFRKLRPTIAMRPNREGIMQVIAGLCLHPLGYYAESWAGVLCPTDDVIAHLMMMRGCEHQFWKKANHHPMWAASIGV